MVGLSEGFIVVSVGEDLDRMLWSRRDPAVTRRRL
jgi:hypothetical protein